MWKKIFGSLCLSLEATTISFAATLTVDLNGGADYTDIQAAIDAAAADGDTVLIKPGDYVVTEPITFKGKAITVKSEGGAEVTTIRISETPADPGRASVVIFENREGAESKLEGFRLTGGKGTLDSHGEVWGGGVYCAGGSSPALTSCTISGNGAGGFFMYRGGGGLFCDNSSPTLTNCTISGNSGTWSGGVGCAGGSSPTLTSCTIAGNSACCGGGVFCEGSSPILTSCTISGNSSAEGGGVFCSGGSPTLTNCTISGNSSAEGGGVFCDADDAENSSPTLESCIVWDNAGGSIAAEAESAPLVSFSCIEGEEVWPGEGNINLDPRFCGFPAREARVADQQAFEEALGGFSLGLSTDSPCLGTGAGGTDMGSKGRGCDAPGEAALLLHLAAGTYKISGFGLAHRVSLEGAGEEKTTIEGTVLGLRTGAAFSRLTVTGGTIGGIVVPGGEAPEISNCTIAGNHATSGWFGRYYLYGGGVSCEGGSPTLTNCTISSNCAACIAMLCFGAGGGLYLSGGSPTITDCAISGNSAGGQGGGVCCWGSSPTLTGCTISGNSSGEGGGVFCFDSSPTLTNCTITGNSAVNGGGVYSWDSDSSPKLSNCIVWGNTPESTCGDLSFCLTDRNPLFVRPWEWVECGAPDDPLCIAYEWSPDTGEPTAWHRWIPGDYHLQAGSPCIDAGTSDGAPTTDIEGHGRPCGKGVDIGAYEFGDCSASGTRFVRGNVDGKGGIDISDPIFLLTYLFLGGKAPDCLDAGDANDDGSLDLSDAVYSLTFQFLGGDPPKNPYPECGIKGWINGLDCQSYSACP